MADVSTEKEIHYCYQCRTRVRPNLENCWYCGVPVHRTIRPVRRCPFCAEPIRPESIKCRHCGEFLDGREKVQPQSVQQMVIIDKDAMRTLSSMRPSPTALPGAGPSPHLLAQQPPPAIEADYSEHTTGSGSTPTPVLPEHVPLVSDDYPLGPTAQDQPVAGRLALPAPEGQTEHPIVSRPTALPARSNTAAAEGALMRRPTQLPARQVAQPLATRPPAVPSAAPLSPASDTAIDAEAADLYRRCELCGTEVLQSDNYCYHCGKKFRRTPKDAYREALERRRRLKQAFGTFLAVLLLGGVAAAVYFWIQGDLPLERITEIEPAARRAIKGDFDKALEELKTFDPKVIAQAEQCRKNLERIQMAKQAAATKKGGEVSEVSLEEVLKELGTDKLPLCPTSGTYTLQPLWRMPTCSIGDNGTSSALDDHILPARR
ncbi:MAG: hypothetical protein N3D11_03580 [Candidatus Sumerlaeia bacterium]|nr:hypothetical protein [Candidatus Sumerlaeia bacterium]